MLQFKSLQDVIIRFSDEKTCIAYLEQMRWNGKPECTHCGCSKVYRCGSVNQPYMDISAYKIGRASCRERV